MKRHSPLDYTESAKTYRLDRLTVLAAAVGYCLIALAIFHDTAFSIVSIWIRSETFTHGFLILPISLWLIWLKRFELSQLQPVPAYRALTPLAGAGFIWLLGDVTQVLVVQQLALVALLISGIWLIVGTRAISVIAFPLGFLFFAVPMGEGLIPWMMDFTATFIVRAVELTGVPVYREGLFIYLPTGTWSVVEACSGVRYLIASITLGCLFAYLNYTGWKKRSAFIAASAIVPIIANGLRAYMIVMIGHFSDMKLAVGIDHLIYGWIFFGVVILILFMVGSIWRDRQPLAAGHRAKGPYYQSISRTKPYAPLLVALAVLAVWPILAFGLGQQHAQPVEELSAPAATADMEKLDSPPWDWQPDDGGADFSVVEFYSYQNTPVGLYLHQYLSQEQGEEVVRNFQSLTGAKINGWRTLTSGTAQVDFQGRRHQVEEYILTRFGVQLRVWRWYRIGSFYTANNYLAKAAEAFSKLTFGRLDSARLMIVAPVSPKLGDTESSSQTMAVFARKIMPEVEKSLDRVTGAES